MDMFQNRNTITIQIIRWNTIHWIEDVIHQPEVLLMKSTLKGTFINYICILLMHIFKGVQNRSINRKIPVIHRRSPSLFYFQYCKFYSISHFFFFGFHVHRAYGTLPNPVKPAVVVYHNNPGKIENFTPGHSSVSEKERKEVSVEFKIYYHFILFAGKHVLLIKKKRYTNKILLQPKQ